MKTILVIDDELPLVQVMCLILQNAGYAVLTAWNGQVGLTVLADHSVDLILCDVMMPIMTGPALCRALQHDSTHSAPPVILMSGTGKPLDSEVYRCTAYLAKPFERTDLIEAVKTSIGSAESP